MNPADRGPSSERVAKFDSANPIHAGIAANPEQNPNHTIRGTGKERTITSRVQPGSEATPKMSKKYPSFNTETSKADYEDKRSEVVKEEKRPKGPGIEYIPAAKKPEKKSDAELDKPRAGTDKLKSHGQKLQDKEAAKREAIARQNAIAAKLKKSK